MNLPAIQFKRTSIHDGDSEILTICEMDNGWVRYSEVLKRETGFVVQVTSCSRQTGFKFVGLFDLDRERIDGSYLSWTACWDWDVPDDVAEAVESGWQNASTTIERIKTMVFKID